MAETSLNLLSEESSPYLKLHADQPVHWMPWGDAAFKKAEKENKPVLLSIGYSTCHWCHVMARESFADQGIADYLNEHFISIKLDREERPDIDSIYMTSHQAMHEGAGGWPLNIFLTPERRPFFSGTYFPPTSTAGSPGFDQVLQGIHDAWEEKEEAIETFSKNLVIQLGSPPPNEVTTSKLEKNFLALTRGHIRASGDQVEFGWGHGPKFPQASLIRFLLYSENSADREFALNTCRKMASSGLYDHINGGFHRYCVDQEWVVPHFEKMLYSQAQLLEAYLDAFLLSKDDYFSIIARETCNYILREMTSPEGSFYSAQDAQSEGKEGKFSCWTLSELTALFSKEEVSLLYQHFNLSKEGNFYDFSDPKALKNQNVLVVKKPLSSFSEVEQTSLTALKKRMFTVRGKRIPPAIDTKIQLSWNGLMIAGLARAGMILEEESYLNAAIKAHETLLKTHHREGIYYHSAKDSQSHGQNIGSDLSCLLYATRTLYHCTLEQSYLDLTLKLSDSILELFYDKKQGGFYETIADESLILRMKGDFDNALPTVSSQMVRELTLLSKLTDDSKYQEALDKTLAYYQPTLQSMPYSMGELLLSLSQTSLDSTVVLTGYENPKPFLTLIHQAFPPPLALSNSKGLNEFYQSLISPESGIRAYHCEGKSCNLPTESVEKLRTLLDK